MTRNEMLLEINEAKCTTVGFRFARDERVQEVYNKWIDMGATTSSVLILEHDHAGREISEVIPPLE
jgi:hypothetical protein